MSAQGKGSCAMNECVFASGFLSDKVRFRIVLEGEALTLKEMNRLIQKLELDRDILAELIDAAVEAAGK